MGRDLYNYQGKLIVVTGASSGLGWKLAEFYRERGAFLALVARRENLLVNLAHQLDSSGKEVKAFPINLTETEKIPTLVKEIVDFFGRPVDVLLHCAATLCHGEIELCPYSAIRDIMALNYLAGVQLVQSVVGDMRKRHQGQIIWIGSGAAFRGIPYSAGYCASKAAAKTFCESIRNELKESGIDVLFVIPGALKTDFHHHQIIYSRGQNARPTGAGTAAEKLATLIVKYGERHKEVLIYGRNVRIGRHLAYWFPRLLDRLYRSHVAEHS